MLNPVEVVQAHVYFTKIVSKFGVRQIVRMANKYKVPMAAARPLARLICLGYVIVYAMLSNTGGLVLPKNIPGDQFVALVKALLLGLKRSVPVFKILQNGKEIVIPWEAVDEMFDVYLPILLEVGSGSPPRDGNYLIQTVLHFLRILS